MRDLLSFAVGAVFFVAALFVLSSKGGSALAQRPPPGRAPVPGRPRFAAGGGGDEKSEEPGTVEAYQNAEFLFVGKVTDVQYGPVARSMPPIYQLRLGVTVEESFRGGLGHEAAAFRYAALRYAARQVERPAFEVGDRVIVAATQSRSGFTASSVLPATAARLELAKALAELPLGWSITRDGAQVSPWAGKLRWQPAWGWADDGAACAESGRPALQAGPVRVGVEKVPPAREIKWTNPDGDGEYTFTVANPGAAALEVPALLSDASGIRWDLSLLIRCQGRGYLVPGARPAVVDGALAPTVIGPGEQVTHPNPNPNPNL
uniref:Uncharacterized protein n=1 Tax=Phaeomonas parva TaxID=124430 RepID=A0A7S1XY55_9STRA|mmetsp:Transcript_43424/g.136115  ORF Transcript_43424/g.136115 Transcript_43424/m.136115 type:complete len:319 (+) Transcript_43424:251-1207(+)